MPKLPLFDPLNDELDEALKHISRRDMLKLSALLGSTALFNPSSLSASEDNNTTKKPKSTSANGKKIVIIGGGDAGITISARLANSIDKPDITVIEPNDTLHYQPGQTLVGSGVWQLKDIAYKITDHLNPNVKLIQDSVSSIDAPNNSVTLASNAQVIPYDYLVVATGLKYDYEFIEGFNRSMLGKKAVHSIYAPEDTQRTFEEFKNLAQMSKSKKVRAIFTHPHTPIKCGGAPKKIMYLFEHFIRREGNIKNVEIVFAANGGKHFGVPEYEPAVKQQFKERNIVEKFKHNLVKVDTSAKKATFVHTYEEKGEYDEFLEMHDVIVKKEYVSMTYDFLHITPPMHASDAVKNSDLSWQKGTNGKYGFVEVDDQTLQHKRYENVFSAGDVIGTRYGKTGGSVRKQAPVVAQNILHVIEGKIEREHYDGYTVCPIVTGYGSVLLAEFNYQGAAPSFPLDPTKDRWIWWILKVYMLKPMYFHGMLKGRM